MNARRRARELTCGADQEHLLEVQKQQCNQLNNTNIELQDRNYKLEQRISSMTADLSASIQEEIIGLGRSVEEWKSKWESCEGASKLIVRREKDLQQHISRLNGEVQQAKEKCKLDLEVLHSKVNILTILLETRRRNQKMPA